MDRVQFVTHNGVRILKVDYSHTTNVEENLATLEKARAVIGAQPLQSLRLMTVTTKTHFNLRAVEAMKQYTKLNTPFLKASAVVGVSTIQKVIYDALVVLTGRSIPCFDTEEQALDYLATQ
jgi:hypothetical protein